MHPCGQRVIEGEAGLAQPVVGHRDRAQQYRRADAGPQRLAQRLLGSEALGQEVGRLLHAREFLQFGRSENAPRDAVTVLRQHALETRDAAQVGADTENHAALPAASRISAFISRTASRRPTNTERLTMAWPMCSSRTPGSSATGCTLA